MPELPEVEIMTRNLRRWLEGRQLIDVEVLDATVLSADPGAPSPVGSVVGRVFRRGKYTCLEAGDQTLVLHYRMTGKVIRWPWSPPRRRIRLSFSAPGVRVGLADPRRFAKMWQLPTTDVPAFFAARSLGPDAWPQTRPGTWWAARFARKRGPIKTALLDQSCVAGIGNIAASEICWRTQLHPEKPCPALSASQWDAVAQHTVAYMEETIESSAADEIAYVTAGGSNPFAVYGRAGGCCPRCSRLIERLVQAGRSTFFCADCQR